MFSVGVSCGSEGVCCGTVLAYPTPRGRATPYLWASSHRKRTDFLWKTAEILWTADLISVDNPVGNPVDNLGNGR